MPNILIVDDAAVERRMVEGLLEKDESLKLETAANGREALERIEESRPDLVLTDLQMPEMDGLELVGAIRERWPGLPVVLMTAFGSKALAAEALQRGAASYVPKSRLAETLHATVRQVLALSHSDQAYERIIDSLIRTEFTLRLENDAALFEPLIELIQQIASAVGICNPSGLLRLGTALEEALLNAVYRGNLELSSGDVPRADPGAWDEQARDLVEERRALPPYCDRHVLFDVRVTPEHAQFTIRDQGPGFSHSSSANGKATVLAAQTQPPGAAQTPPPSSSGAGRLAAAAGKGLVLMRSFFDEVSFNPAGNEVTLIKRPEA